MWEKMFHNHIVQLAVLQWALINQKSTRFETLMQVDWIDVLGYRRKCMLNITVSLGWKGPQADWKRMSDVTTTTTTTTTTTNSNNNIFIGDFSTIHHKESSSRHNSLSSAPSSSTSVLIRLTHPLFPILALSSPALVNHFLKSVTFHSLQISK